MKTAHRRCLAVTLRIDGIEKHMNHGIWRRAGPALCMTALLAASTAFAQVPAIRVGEINSYSAPPGVREAYRKGMELAVEEIRAAGGVLGKRFELEVRNDDGDPAMTVHLAATLVDRDKVTVLIGGMTPETSHVLAEFAQRRGLVYLATGTLVAGDAWQAENPFTVRAPGAPGAQDSTAVRFARTHLRRFGEPPGPGAWTGYAAIRQLVAAITSAGGTEPAALAAALRRAQAAGASASGRN